MGCYSFANHVLPHHPEVPLGFAMPTVLEALRGRAARCRVHASSRAAPSRATTGRASPAAVAGGAEAELAVVVVGDQAGLFGRGTVGEGNDSETLDLPGVQRELVEAVVATGTPVVLVLLTGRPYALDWALDGPAAPSPRSCRRSSPARRAASRSPAYCRAGSNPSGRLPVTLPRAAGRSRTPTCTRCSADRPT